jgi:hypothetical protein
MRTPEKPDKTALSQATREEFLRLINIAKAQDGFFMKHKILIAQLNQIFRRNEYVPQSLRLFFIKKNDAFFSWSDNKQSSELNRQAIG